MDLVSQNLLLSSGGKKDSTYIDDVFSTYLYKGNGNWTTPTPPLQTINTGLDMSGEGGLLWIKQRVGTGSSNHILLDTVRGANKTIKSDSNAAEVTSSWGQTFTPTGFTLNNSFNETNANNETYSSWSFRKAPGFFDIVTYTGNSQANRVVTHNLGSVPGCIMIKRLTGSIEDWRVYHRGTDLENPGDYYLRLNQDHARNDADTFMDTIPTSTQFLLNSYSDVNASGETYIAYIFAGGASTAATARSVYFGGDASLVIPSSSDLTLGTGDFTIETWVYPQSFGNRSTIYDGRSSGGTTGITIGWEASSGQVRVYMNATNGSDIVVQSDDLEMKQWQHIAVTRSSGTVRLFINGVLKGSATRTSDLNNTNAKIIGFRSYTSSSYDHMHGAISNFRLVKGTAVYTSSFNPSTQPLTDITNTKLLCCNNVSVTGATVTPGTITVGTGGHNGNPVARVSNPFDDPEGFKFGEEGDQNIIKMGAYRGNANANGPEVYLGWEPQWLLIKRSNNNEQWFMFDCMRGIVSGGNDSRLEASNAGAEDSGDPYLKLTPRGFQLTTTSWGVNGNGDTYVYTAIRRPDGYVGKPVEVGTDVLAMDTGTASATIPNFDSGFPVDFATTREPATTQHWYTGARLIQEKYIYTDLTNAEAGWDKFNFDSNVGWADWTGFSGSWQSWMWKRHAGFDVVTYTGNSTAGHQIPHSLSKSPEMIWIKRRSGTNNWAAGHKGLNGGSTPWDYFLNLDSTGAESNDDGIFYDTAPTATHFTLGTYGQVNGNNETYIAMLFASVEGISKCGYFTGTGSEMTITTGFQPRFLILRKSSATNENWEVLDTTRGWGAGNDQRLRLNTNATQSSTQFGTPTSTGFTLPSNWTESGYNFIYYAHA